VFPWSVSHGDKGDEVSDELDVSRVGFILVVGEKVASGRVRTVVSGDTLEDCSVECHQGVGVGWEACLNKVRGRVG